jgi:hypothetical protein
VVERVENMQSTPTAAAQTNEEPSSSVISAEQQHLRVRSAAFSSCRLSHSTAGRICYTEERYYDCSAGP